MAISNTIIAENMKLRFEIDQADSFRRGIDRPKSIVSIEINPADLSEENRTIVANHLIGIDVITHFYRNGEIIKGYPLKELSHTTYEPKRIVAKAANIEGLLEAIEANDRFIQEIKKSFDRPVQFQIIEKPPKNESDFIFITDQSSTQLEEVERALQQKRRIFFECFLHDVQHRLNKTLHAHSYAVYLLPTPPMMSAARFYCEPIFAAEFMGRPVIAHSPVIVLNEKTGRIVEAGNLFEALDIYLLPGIPRVSLVDNLSILSWDNGKWTIVDPEWLIDCANEAKQKKQDE